MRCYKPAVCLQAYQILDKVYVVDTLKLGLVTEVLEDSAVIKITSKVTPTAIYHLHSVVETGCAVLEENLQTNVDFRQRPVP